MWTRRDFLVAGTAAAALAATPSGVLCQTPGRHQTARDAVPPTSPNSVSTRPPEHLSGSTTSVGRNPGDLQKAINASATGDTLVVPAGVTYNAITLPKRDDGQWIVIRSSEASNLPVNQRVRPTDARHMFRVLSDGAVNTARAVTIPYGSNGWYFIGMEATHLNDNNEYGLVDVIGRRTAFERCYIHGRTTQAFMGRCIRVYGSDFQIWDSWLSEAKAIGYECQAIYFSPNDGDWQLGKFHVENCELQAGGENIMLADQYAPGPAQDVTIKRNHFFCPYTWTRHLPNGTDNPLWDGHLWTHKNLFEIKRGLRVLVEGNTFEHGWPMAQDGTAILLNAGPAYNAEDVMFRSNVVKNAQFWLTISAVRGGIPNKRCAFLNNLMLGVGGRAALLNHFSEDIWIEHNTVVPLDGVTGVYVGSAPLCMIYVDSDVIGSSWPRLTIKRNVLGKSIYGWFMNGGPPFTDAQMDRYFPDRSFRENAEYGQTGAPPTGWTFYATAVMAGVNLTTGELTSTSPLKRAGSDGKDLGVDFAALNATMNATTSGHIIPPSSATRRRSIRRPTR